MGLEQIIVDSLPFCQETYLRLTRSEHGKEVEVQKQVQVELQRQAQLERQLFNPSLEAYPYESWESYHSWFWGYRLPKDYSKADGFLTLTALCSERCATAPDFGHLYVGRNYYQAYKGQTQFMGVFLKPVHALFFQKHLDGTLNCLILSQQEAEELPLILEKINTDKHTWDPDYWLSTTQHVVLAGQPPAGIQKNETYQGLIEKIQFFNGELSLLFDGDLPLNWLSEGTEQKLAFFEQNLLPYRETDYNDMVVLRQTLSQRSKAFRYIAEHPVKDYTSFEWMAEISNELSHADIEECEQLALAFAYANRHWRDKDLSRQACQKGLRLSLQASSYINRYVDEQLACLRGVFPLCNKGALDEIKSVLDLLLPMLIKEYVPCARSKKQTPLQFLLKKASMEQDSSGLLRVAEWLVQKKADVRALDNDGHSALDLVIQEAGDYVLVPVQWLLARGVSPCVDNNIWSLVNPEMMVEFLKIPVFRGSESFLLAYVMAFKNNERHLQNIIGCDGVSSRVFRSIIEQMLNPTEGFLAAFLAHDLVRTDVAIVQQLLEKVDGTVRQWVLWHLLSLPDIQPNVLAVIVEKSNHFNLQLGPETLKAMLLRGQQVGVSRLLISILKHEQADAAVVKAVMRYALDVIQPSAFFWKEIPSTVCTLDLSGGNLGQKDSYRLTKIIADLPPSFERIDLSENDIGSQLMLQILAAAPPTVLSIAYEHHHFLARGEMLMTFADHSFHFHCLAKIAMVVGSGALLVGLLAPSLLLAGIGGGIMAAVVVGSLLQYGMFANKPPRESAQPELDLVLV